MRRWMRVHVTDAPGFVGHLWSGRLVGLTRGRIRSLAGSPAGHPGLVDPGPNQAWVDAARRPRTRPLRLVERVLIRQMTAGA
jgi:hypothetical protein